MNIFNTYIEYKDGAVTGIIYIKNILTNQIYITYENGVRSNDLYSKEVINPMLSNSILLTVDNATTHLENLNKLIYTYSNNKNIYDLLATLGLSNLYISDTAIYLQVSTNTLINISNTGQSTYIRDMSYNLNKLSDISKYHTLTKDEQENVIRLLCANDKLSNELARVMLVN